MRNGCDICMPQHRGYSIYFKDEQSIGQLEKYFRSFPEDQWTVVEDKLYWAEETVFFDLLDYLEAHMDAEKVLAVGSKRTEPQKDMEDMRPIATFQLEKQASWIDDLIKQRAIKTHYQPIVTVKNQNVEVIGHELLSRGIDETGTLIPPFKMFEAARVRNRLFALDRVCRLESVKNAQPATDKLIFINFIPTAIYVPEHCLATTFKLIKQLNMKPEQIVFEVVETDEVKDIEHLKSILRYYQAHGFKYALDDVGTGVNDLKKLNDLKPHYVKLAREYVDGVSTDPEKQSVAKSVLEMARNIGSRPLAEGIERPEDLTFLTDIGYELFQGYYFAKPQENPVERITLNDDIKT
ncbi:EAL domain-containing protein [Lentibacillus sediminis]|uniref:EAL domain-containing protein n=1 Tax=Lentibacillus sediminis TaxID=1940529 RepID=UPI000C1C2CAC|nr:EAL domain-containing protein [Lentibacillus sediminis]